MKMKLAMAAHNTEKCFEHGLFATAKPNAVAKLLELVPGDMLVFYKSKAGFAGIWQVDSIPYEDESKVWEDGTYPWRIKIKPLIALRPDQYVDPRTMLDELSMVTHPLYWGIAFRQNLKDLDPKDYEQIKKRLEKQVSPIKPKSKK
jgi:hypothetical protein